jgi:hypothetical protein
MLGKAATTAATVEKRKWKTSSDEALPDGPQESEIAIAAYYLWVNRGCPGGVGPRGLVSG